MPPVFAAVGAVIGAISGAVAAVAGVVSSLGIIGSIALSAGLSLVGSLLKPKSKPPPARGSVTQINLDPDAPQPYVMGEGLVGGAIRHDAAYGPTIDDVPNPYRFLAIVYSGGGPVQEITPYVDQAPVDTGYYGGFLAWDNQFGYCPETESLEPILYGPVPGWDPSSARFSGQAALAWNLKFDKDGKKFASGVPQLGAYGKWVKVYDPRHDSTFPGGSGSHRLGDESTYEWSENPALHAGTYAYGRYQNGKRTIGVGLPADAVDWPNIAAWANVCDANAWRLFGIVYEPDDRWQNLKDIAAAGGGVPLIANGILSFHYSAPRVSLDTITEADISEADMSVTAMQSWRDRLNTIIPKYRSPEHNWELISADAVDVPTYVAEDGEVKRSEWPFNFVKDVDQAAQLARYVLEDGRELQPIEITCHPRFHALRPGDCVDLDLPSLGLDTPAVILRREFDPGNLTVKFILIGETAAKHAYALGQTTTPPPTPSIGQTSEERDQISGTVLIGSIGPAGPAGPAGPTGGSGSTGAAAVTAYLTRESVAIYAYADGTVVNFTNGNGQFKLMQGNTDITASATFYSDGGVGCTGTINTATNTPVSGQPKGYYQITALIADEATLTMTATVGGVTFTKIFNIARLKAGFEAVTSLPTTGNTEGRTVSMDGKLYVYTSGGWIRSTSPPAGSNLLLGAIPGTNPNRYARIGNNPDGIAYQVNTAGQFSSPLFGDFWIGNAWTLPDNGTFGLQQPNAATGSSGFTDVHFCRPINQAGTLEAVFSTEAGKAYELSAYTGAHRCNVSVGIAYFSDTTFISESLSAVNNTHLGGASLADYKRLVVRSVAPSGATRALFFIRKGHTASGLDSWLFVAHPMAAEAPAGSTDTLPWSPPPQGFFYAETAVFHSVTADQLATSGIITNTAQINSAVIITGHIQDLAVDTLKIAGQAVNNVQTAYTPGYASYAASTWTTLQSVSITTSGVGGSIVTLKAGANIYISDASFLSVEVQIVRDGTVIYGPAIIPQSYVDVATGPYSGMRVFFCNFLGTLSFNDSPSAGGHTYSFQINSSVASGSSTNPLVSARYLEAIETKK